MAGQYEVEQFFAGVTPEAQRNAYNAAAIARALSQKRALVAMVEPIRDQIKGFVRVGNGEPLGALESEFYLDNEDAIASNLVQVVAPPPSKLRTYRAQELTALAAQMKTR